MFGIVQRQQGPLHKTLAYLGGDSWSRALQSLPWARSSMASPGCHCWCCAPVTWASCLQLFLVSHHRLLTCTPMYLALSVTHLCISLRALLSPGSSTFVSDPLSGVNFLTLWCAQLRFCQWSSAQQMLSSFPSSCRGRSPVLCWGLQGRLHTTLWCSHRQAPGFAACLGPISAPALPICVPSTAGAVPKFGPGSMV